MNFVDAVKKCFSNYVGFSGRAPRSEYWWWMLFFLLYAILMIAVAGADIANLAMLPLFLPTFAVAARRLHDIGKSGWWQLLSFIPLIGGLVLLYWAVQPGEGDNAYGPAT